MDQFVDKNVDSILQRVEALFTGKIVPFIEKTVQDQKESLVSDIRIQVENSFIKRLNGEEKIEKIEQLEKTEETEKTEKKEEPYYVECSIKDRTNNEPYKWMINPKYKDYDFEKMKKFTSEIFLQIKNDENFKVVVDIIRNQPNNRNWERYKDRCLFAVELFQIFEQLYEEEYITCIYMDSENYDGTRIICLITNFGSIYSSYYHANLTQFRNSNIIPKPILDLFINNYFDYNPYYSSSYYLPAFNIFKNSVTEFQKWWQSRPLTGYTAELLKKENEDLKEQVEKTQQEQERIKHMYETLELKDQYYKAVELLKQNKTERDSLEKDRKDFHEEQERIKKEFHQEKEERERKLEEKIKKYRQIKDIDTELTRLAFIKQKFEKEKAEFDKEKAKFEDLRDSLIEDF